VRSRFPVLESITISSAWPYVDLDFYDNTEDIDVFSELRKSYSRIGVDLKLFDDGFRP